MEYLNIFIGLISKTEGRDKTLRLIQYATLHANEMNNQGKLAGVYRQMRITRKVLRFLRTLEYVIKLRQQIPKIFSQASTRNRYLLWRIVIFLQNLFGLAFFLFDHKVFLTQVGLLNKNSFMMDYFTSYRCYLLENLFGVIKNVIEVSLICYDGKFQDKILDHAGTVHLIKKKTFELIKNLLDVLVALYYSDSLIPSSRASIIGVLTSIMSIMQILNLV